MRNAPTIAVLLLALLLAACAGEPFPQRRRTAYGSFGEEVYDVLVRELELMEPLDEAEARVHVLSSQSDDPERDPGRWVKDALEQAIADPVGDTRFGLRSVIESGRVLSLFDDGSMGLLGTFVADTLDRILEETRPGGQDARVPEALATLARAPGGSNPDALLHLLHRLASVEEVRVAVPNVPGGVEVTTDEVPADLAPGMAKLYSQQEQGVRRLHDWLAAELQAVEPEQGEEGGVDPVARRLLEPVCGGLTATDLHAGCEADLEALALGAPAWTVLVGPGGAPETGPGMEDAFAGISPFANRSEKGERRPGDEDEGPRGLAFNPRTSRHLYRYADLKQSLFALALDGTRRIGDRGYVWDLAAVLPALLGERAGGGGGYMPDDNVALDLTWALRTLATYPRLPLLLKVLEDVAEDGEGARLLSELLASFGRATAVVSGQEILTPRNDLFDHLVGDNELRALEVGKPCGEPPNQAPDQPDPCSASWLECGTPDDPEDRGGKRCMVAAPAPGILEELAEPGVRTDAAGNRHVEPPLLRKLFAAMSDQAAALAGLAEGLATMMEWAVQEDHAAYSDLYCDIGTDLPDGTLDALHALPFEERTRWHEAEGRTDMQSDGSFDRMDPTRSLNQKLVALMYDTNRAEYLPALQIRGVNVPMDILRIDNLAVYYLDAAAANTDVDTRYYDGDPEESAGEFLFNATARGLLCEMRQDDDDGDPLTALAEQVDLFILRDHASTGDALLDLGNPHCNLGFEVRHHHGSMLVANVTARNLAALRPIIRLFSRYGMNEGGQPDPPRNTRIPGGRTQLLADLFSTLHVHYSAHTQNVDRAFDTELQHPDFDKQYGTGFRRAEPYAVGIVRDPGSNPPGGARRDLFSVFLRFGALLDRTAVCLTETSPGRSCPPDLEVNAAEEVVTFVAWLLDRDARVCPREERWAQWGSAPETDAATEATLCTHSAGPMRGRRLESDRERRPSRLQLLIEAFRLVDDRLRVPSRAGAKAAWEHLNLLDLLLEVDDQGELANRGTVHVVRVALSILSDSLADAWSSYGCNPLDPLMAEPCKGFVEETDDFYTESRRFLGTAELADTLALLGVVRADPELRQWVDMLLAVMVHASDDPEQDVSGALLSLLAHVIQLDVGEDDVLEVVRFLGRVLEADSWYANRLVATLGRLREADEGHVVAALLRNLTTEDRRSARSRFPLRTLKDVIADASRPDPAETGPYTAEDYRAVVRKTRDFMRDEIHGFQRIVDVTKSRLP